MLTAIDAETENFQDVVDVVDGALCPEDDVVVSSDLERTGVGRREKWRAMASSVVIACCVVITAAGLVPTSATSVKVRELFGSPIKETGIRQNWGMFSPDPLQIDVQLAAVVYFEDGSSSDWSPPTQNLFDTSRSERWRKWESRVRLDKNAAHWPIAAHYIASQFADYPSTVVKVQLVRTWTQVPLPPEPNSDRQVQEFQFYEWDHLTSTGTELTRADQVENGSSP